MSTTKSTEGIEALSHRFIESLKSARRFLLAVFCLALFAAWLLAASVTNLRPTADGGTQQWQNNAGTSCASADCYLEVDESSGGNCTTTPGDGTINHSTTTINQIQTFDLDESSIADNSTLQSAVVYGCVARGGAQNANFRFKVRIDGIVTNCASTSTSTSTPTDFNCSIDFADVTKGGSTDFEIGIENTQARDVHLDAVKADITYTPPSGRSRVVVIASKVVGRELKVTD